MFLDLIHHNVNNRNKSINFIFMWNQANKKKIDAAGNLDAGGDDKLNFFFYVALQRIEKNCFFFVGEKAVNGF